MCKRETTKTKALAAKGKMDVERKTCRTVNGVEHEWDKATEWSEGIDLRGAARLARAEMKSIEASRKAAEKARLLKEDMEYFASVKKIESRTYAFRPSETIWQSKVRRPTEIIFKKMKLEENMNRHVEKKWTSGIDGALKEVHIFGTKAYRYPEKRLKASTRIYEEARLPAIRDEKPGLKLSQYRRMILKEWQRSPENPMNHIL